MKPQKGAKLTKNKIDDLAKSRKTPIFVIPAKAGIQGIQPLVDSRFRGSDGLGDFLHGRQNWIKKF